MDLNTAKDMALKLMTNHGLATWNFEFDNAKRRLGLCRYDLKIISLSTPLALLNNEVEVRNTILHEIAHALLGKGHGHNRLWQSKAVSIGCNGERCSSGTIEMKRTWQAACERCGDLEIFRFKRLLNSPTHTRCGGAINWKKIEGGK